MAFALIYANEWTETDRQTDVIDLVVALRNCFNNSPKSFNTKQQKVRKLKILLGEKFCTVF